MEASGTDRLFAGSIPDVSDRYRVPLIFESHAFDSPSTWQCCGQAGGWRQ